MPAHADFVARVLPGQTVCTVVDVVLKKPCLRSTALAQQAEIVVVIEFALVPAPAPAVVGRKMLEMSFAEGNQGSQGKLREGPLVAEAQKASCLRHHNFGTIVAEVGKAARLAQVGKLAPVEEASAHSTETFVVAVPAVAEPAGVLVDAVLVHVAMFVGIPFVAAMAVGSTRPAENTGPGCDCMHFGSCQNIRRWYTALRRQHVEDALAEYEVHPRCIAAHQSSCDNQCEAAGYCSPLVPEGTSLDMSSHLGVVTAPRPPSLLVPNCPDNLPSVPRAMGNLVVRSVSMSKSLGERYRAAIRNDASKGCLECLDVEVARCEVEWPGKLQGCSRVTMAATCGCLGCYAKL